MLLRLNGLSLFCNNFSWYFDNTINFFNNFTINLNRHFNSHNFCDYLLNLNFFYYLFLYLSDHLYLHLSYLFPYDFYLYFNLFLDEAVDVNRDFLLYFSYHFFLNVKWDLLLYDSIPLYENRFLNLSYLFNYNWLLD